MLPTAFLIRVTAIGVALNLYVGLRIIPALPLSDFYKWIVASLLLANLAAMALGLTARFFAEAKISDRLAWIGMFLMGLFSTLLVLTVIRDIVLFALLPVEFWSGFNGREFATFTSSLVPGLALALALIGLLHARRTARITTIEVPITGLERALHGFTIVQISDIHIGSTIKRAYVERIVASVNELMPDLIALTGDLVDGSVGELAGDVSPISTLSARHGSFFVTGNHEYYSGVDQWVAEVRRLGLNVLMNQHVVLNHDGARAVIAGVTDYGAGSFDPAHTSDPAKAIFGAPADVPFRLLLAHQPRSATAASAAGFTLQLSGHTHGGQFFPWNLFIRLQQPFVHGLRRLDNLWVYTSRGTGYWGPPTRLGAPSEITRLLLVPHRGEQQSTNTSLIQ